MAGALLNQPLRDQLVKSCASSEEITKVSDNRRNAEFAMDSNKRMLEIQTRIIEACLSKGGIPSINGGQVDCRATFSAQPTGKR